MSKPTLILTVGLPRSGKSTWAMQQDCPVVNPDAIRLALHGRPFIAEAEPMVWAIAKYMVRALFKAGHRCVILDATNTTRKRRDEWRSDEWQRAFEVFPTHPSICINRCFEMDAPLSHQAVLANTVQRMAADWESIEAEEWDA